MKKVYFSVSHLVQDVVVQKTGGEEVNLGYIAIRGKDYKGKTRWQALGGGAKLNQRGKKVLKNWYGDDIEFRAGEESTDARFYLPIGDEFLKTSNVAAKNGFVATVLLPFIYTEYLESSVIREVKDELGKKAPQVPTPVHQYYPYWTREKHTTLSPIKWKSVGSNRADGAVLYERIFHLHTLVVKEDVWSLFIDSPNIRLLSKEDIRLIRESTKKGVSMTELPDGSIVAENIFPW